MYCMYVFMYVRSSHLRCNNTHRYLNYVQASYSYVNDVCMYVCMYDLYSMYVLDLRITRPIHWAACLTASKVRKSLSRMLYFSRMKFSLARST